MHPLVDNFDGIKDAELETKVGELTKKYFMTHNVELRTQIVSLLESYKEELSKRRQAAWEKMMENRDKGLDKLINVS